MASHRKALGVVSKKKWGQHFLVCKHIAQAEADFGINKKVIEIGSGRGILTKALCEKAKHVISFEIDSVLYEMLKGEIEYKNLEIHNMDFFDANEKMLDGYEMLIANIPYNLSSKIVEWSMTKKIDAVLCMQKEFCAHMLAKPNSHAYSKISVMCSLMAHVGFIMNVPAGCFMPIPKVDSSVVYIKPKKEVFDPMAIKIMGHIMEHKKKKAKGALIDSCKALGISKDRMKNIVLGIDGLEKRGFQMEPLEMYNIALQIKKNINV